MLNLEDLPYETKKEFLKVMLTSFKQYGKNFLLSFNEENISLFYHILNDTDSEDYKKMKEIVFLLTQEKLSQQMSG